MLYKYYQFTFALSESPNETRTEPDDTCETRGQSRVLMNPLFQSVRVRVTENAVTGDDASDPGAGIGNIASAAGIGTGSVIVSAIARGKGTVIEIGNVITANHIRESDHAAEKENANVKEIVNIESEAEKKGKPNDLNQIKPSCYLDTFIVHVQFT